MSMFQISGKRGTDSSFVVEASAKVIERLLEEVAATQLGLGYVPVDVFAGQVLEVPAPPPLEVVEGAVDVVGLMEEGLEQSRVSVEDFLQGKRGWGLDRALAGVAAVAHSVECRGGKRGAS